MSPSAAALVLSLFPASFVSSGSDDVAVLAPRAIATMPRGLSSHAAAALDGWLYVYGGYFGEPHEYCREDQSRAFLRLNLRDGVSWEQLSEEPGVQSVALVSHGGALYRFGGMVAENERYDEPALRSTVDAARFDPTTRSWSALPDLPEPRSSHAACVAGDQAVIVGGWDLGGKLGRESAWSSTVSTLDLTRADATWNSVQAPFKRRALAAASLNGRVFAIGGMDENGKPSARVDVLELATQTWSLGPELPETGFGCAAATCGASLFASAKSGRVWRLDGDAGRWIAHSELIAPRYFHQLAVADPTTLLAVGGILGSRRTRLIERISLDEVAAPRIETVVIPSPGAAKNRQAAFVHDGALFLFGGNQRIGQHAFDDAAFVDEGWKLELSTLEWSALPALPVRRQSMQTTVAQGLAWLVGGFARSESGTQAFGDAFAFDPKLETWRAMPDVVKPGRTQFALVEHGDALWMFGGLDYVQGRDGGADFHHPLDVLKRALNAEHATRFTPSGVELPRERRAFGHALLDGRLYLVGGLADGFADVPECDVFDFENGAWTTIPSPSITRISPELVALDGKLYLAGGSGRIEKGGDPGPIATIECFDPASGAWSTLGAQLPFDPTHVRMFAHRGRLLVVSTHDAQARTARLAWISP